MTDADDTLRRLNEEARVTGKTRAELLTEARDILLADMGQPLTGLEKWVDKLKQAFRRPTEADRANRHVFEETQRRQAEPEMSPDVAASFARPKKSRG